MPGYRGVHRRGEGRAGRPLQGDRGGRGPGPSPVPPTCPCVRGKEAAGRAGEDRKAVNHLLLGGSPGTAPGEPRNLSSLPSLLDSSSSACAPGAAAGEPPMTPYTLSPDGPSRRHGGFRVGPGSEGCHDFGGGGPAESPGAGGRAPRDVAVPAAVRRPPGPGAEATRSLPRGRRSHQTREEGSCRLPSKLLINNHPGRVGWVASTSTSGTAPGSCAPMQSTRGKHGGPHPSRIFTAR